MTGPADGKLVIRPDAYRVAVPDGVHFLTHPGPIRLTGRAIATWVERLAPSLDGRYTLAELTTGLTLPQRDMVEKVVTALLDSGVVRTVQRSGSGAPQPLTGDERAEYAPELRFVGYFRDAAGAAFARYRAGLTLVVGAGPLVAAVARAALCSGLRSVQVAETGEPASGVVPADLATWHRDHRQRLVWRHHPGPPERELPPLVRRAALVLWAGADADRTAAGLVERLCAQTGIPLGQLVTTGTEVWLVPPAARPAGWATAAWPRLVAADEPRGASVPPPAGAAATRQELSPAAAVAIADRFVHQALSTMTVDDPTIEPWRLARIQPATLRSSEHRLLPHPYADATVVAATEAEFHAQVQAWRSGERIDEAELSRRAAGCLDDRTGLLTLREHDWAQSPLYVSQARVADPLLPYGYRRSPVTAIRAGLGYRAARSQAALAALARYGALLVDPRRLVARDGEAAVDPAGPLANDPLAALRELAAGALSGRAWGWELSGDGPGRVTTVPATVAFPDLSTPDPPAAALAGIAGGHDWHGAVEAGLLGHCRRLAVAGIGSARQPYRRIDPAAVGLDETGQRCRAVLTHLGELTEVYELTGRLGVPTLAFCAGDTTVACTAGTTIAAAMTEGLLATTRAVQARIHRQPAYAPAPAPAIPHRLRDRRFADPDEHRAAGVGSIAGWLRAAGGVPVAVPLDHDPAVTARVPYLANVVLTHA